MDHVPQGDVPPPPHGRQPAVDRQLRLQLQQLRDRLSPDQRRPARAVSPPARPDLLITWTYRIALDGEPKRQGLAAAAIVLIFIIVAVLSAIGFKYTKTYEEIR